MVHRREDGYGRGKVLQVEHGEKGPECGQDQHGSAKFMRQLELGLGNFDVNTL